MRKLIIWVIVVFLLFLAIQDPDATARIFANTIDLLGRVARGIADVVRELFGRE